jgi:hypothetical protein
MERNIITFPADVVVFVIVYGMVSRALYLDPQWRVQVMAVLYLRIFKILFAVMMNLDWITSNGVIQNQNLLVSNLNQLKSGNVDGINVDVWWGIVERSPKQYNWSAYVAIASAAPQSMARTHTPAPNR